MDKLKELLTSTSFWAAVIGLVSTLLIAFNIPQATVTQITSIITSASIIIAFIVGDSIKTSANIKAQTALLMQQEKNKLSNGK